MPLARSYIEGILLGEKIKGLRRQRESEELTDEILRERIKAYRKKDPFEEINLALKQKELEAEPKQPTGEAGWRQEHPGSTHEDYLRATKGISAEFKEEKVPWILKERTKELFITGPKAHKKEITGWVTRFNASYHKHQKDIEKQIREGKLTEIPEESLTKEQKKLIKEGSLKRGELLTREQKRLKFWHDFRLDIPAGDRAEVRQKLGFAMPKGFGEPRKTKKAQISARPQKPINYSGLAQGIKDIYGAETKATLKAYRAQLEESYPGLDWEKLKGYFK